MLSDDDLRRFEADIDSGAHGSTRAIAWSLLAEVRRLRSPLTGEDARLVQEVRERLAKATPGPWEDGDGAILDSDGYSIAHVQYHGNINTITRIGETHRKSDADLIADAPADLQALLDLLSRYEHACHDRELDAGAFVAMERARIVVWLRERAANYRSVGTPHRMDWAMVLEAAADTIEAQGVADPAPPAVVRAELARVRAKVREALSLLESPGSEHKGRELLREALEGEVTHHGT